MLHTRREFLGELGAIGLLAQAPTASPRRIDVHTHFGSPLYVQTLVERTVKPNPGFTIWYALDTFRTYTPARCIEDMDRGGVEVSVVSNTAVGAWFGDLAETRRLARDVNEFAAAKLVQAYKGRFGLFAQLPLPDIDASLKEIEYAFDTLKADGVGLTTSIGNKWLGDPYFAPVFDELNRRNAVVYTHPVDAPCCQALQPGIQATTIEYNTDTSRTILSFLVNETPKRNPNLKFIFSHAGGTLIGLT